MKTIMMIVMAAMLCMGCGLLDQGVQKYDTLVDKDEKCEQAWSNYESNLQRRADMIPQIVSVVKGSAAHEEQTLTAVINARAAATQIKLTGEDLTDPAKVEAFQKAQAQLKGSLSRLMMVQEKYPDLQANKGFHDLQIQIEGTENRLLRAREQYNTTVQAYESVVRLLILSLVMSSSSESISRWMLVLRRLRLSISASLIAASDY